MIRFVRLRPTDIREYSAMFGTDAVVALSRGGDDDACGDRVRRTVDGRTVGQSAGGAGSSGAAGRHPGGRSGGNVSKGCSTCMRNREQLRTETEFDVCRHLRRMSHMGRLIVEHVQSRYPEFNDLPRRECWEEYLPPLDKGLEAVLSRHVLPDLGEVKIDMTAGDSTANEHAEVGESNGDAR